MAEAKRPEFVISDSFEFERFSRRPDFCLAESLFTRLDERDIRRRFQKLTDFVGTGCRFFAVFQETVHKIPQSTPSHSHRVFYYTRAQMEHFGRDCGWEPKHHGNWPHAKHQLMIEYVKR